MTVEMNAEERRAAEAEAMENCEAIPVAFIGTAQKHGWIVAADLDELVVRFASTSAQGHTDLEPQTFVGKPLAAFLDAETVHRLRNVLGHPTIVDQRKFIARTAIENRLFDLSLHKAGDYAVLEFLPAAQDEPTASYLLDAAQTLLRSVASVDDLDVILNLAVGQLRALTGFDRVMTYRFTPDGSGEIVAESHAPEAGSFLGLRFPAEDIPKSARELYERTPIRFIADISEEPGVIVGNGADASHLDLSLAVLRGSPPVHLQYLANMGVRSTLSLPVVVNGEMWGLFSLHSFSPQTLGASALSTYELIGQGLSQAIERQQQHALTALIEDAGAAASAVATTTGNPLGLGGYWDTIAPLLSDLIDCDGVAIVSSINQHEAGACPNDAETAAITAYVKAQRSQIEEAAADAGRGSIAVVGSLSETLPDVAASPVAGFLCIDQPAADIEMLLFFRKSASERTRWAGAPEKDLVDEGDGFRLHPRASFEEYLELNADRCDPWTNHDVLIATALRDALTLVMSATASDREHQQQLSLMVRELNHRVRNILALVNSLVSQSSRDHQSAPEYVSALEERILALGAAHDLLTENTWGALPVESLAKKVLEPYAQRGDRQVIAFVGPDDEEVDAALASLLSLVFHELASNAAKYGALSLEEGQVRVQWSREGENLVLDWQEHGGPPVETPARSGFGMSVIEHALAFEFDASVDLHFNLGGFAARFTIPNRETIVAEPIPMLTTELPRESETSPVLPLDGVDLRTKVLVVEDDFLICQEVTRMLGELGVTEVVTASSVTAALRLIEDTAEISLAVVDANLRGESIEPVARELQRRGVPFIFATGYGSSDVELSSWGATILTKPVSLDRLQSAVEGIG